MTPGERKALSRRMAGDLDNIVLKALQVDPARRYSSTSELADDLSRFLQGLPVHARPGTALYRLGKLIRRHKLAVAAASILLALGTTFAATFVLQAQRIAAERDKAEQINRFITEVFRLSDPDGTDSDTLTARALLDRSATRARAELKHRPALLAAMLQTIGDVYVNIGLYSEAEPILTESLALLEQIYPDDHSELVPALNALGSLYLWMEEIDQAQQLIERALAIGRRRLGTHRHVASSLDLLGQSYLLIEDHEQAMLYYQQSLSMYEKVLGPNHAEVGRLISVLGQAYSEAGDLDQAQTLILRGLEIEEAALGPHSLEVARSCDRLGLIYWARGELDAASSYLSRAEDIMLSILGQSHTSVATVQNNLALIDMARGNLPAAASYYRKALETKRQLLGDETLTYAATAYNLGTTQRLLGHLDEAQDLTRQAVEICRVRLPPGDPHLAAAVLQQGKIELDMGRLELAEELLLESVASLEENPDPLHSRLMVALTGLAELHLDRGDTETAEQLLIRGIDSAPEPSASAWVHRARARCLLAGLRIHKGELADADRLLSDALEDLFSSPEQGRHLGLDQVHAEILINQGLLSERRDRPDQARELWHQALALLEKVPPELTGPDTLRARASTLILLSRSGEAREALQTLATMGYKRPEALAIYQAAVL